MSISNKLGLLCVVMAIFISGCGIGAGNYSPRRSVRSTLHSGASAALTGQARGHYFWRDSASSSHPRRNSSGGTLDR